MFLSEKYRPSFCMKGYGVLQLSRGILIQNTSLFPPHFCSVLFRTHKNWHSGWTSQKYTGLLLYRNKTLWCFVHVEKNIKAFMCYLISPWTILDRLITATTCFLFPFLFFCFLLPSTVKLFCNIAVHDIMNQFDNKADPALRRHELWV